MLLDTGKFEGWPSGNDKPVMRLVMEPDELSRKFNLTFIKEKDDLDSFEASHVYIEEVGFVVFMRHENAPQRGTPVYVDSEVNLSSASRIILETLQLSEIDTNWMAS